MINKVIRAIERYNMLEENDSVTVALSGGADSVCLLYALNALREKYRITLSAVHLNHMLRGNESDRDEAFVRTLCEDLDIPLVVEKADVKAESLKTGDSIELAARRVRYDLFRRVASGKVATAHSADDNLETVLLNMSRGTGLKGACGIPPVRDIFIRPLILCSRTEIEAYLSEKGASFVTDSTNLADDYTRNLLRHKAVPVLKRVNPIAEQSVAVMCETLREDEEFLSYTAGKIYTLCLRDDKLDAELLAIQHPSIIKRVIARYLSEMHGISSDAFHLEACKGLVLFGGNTSLPKGKTAKCEKGRFFVSANKSENKALPVYNVELNEISLQNKSKINNLLLKNAIDCDKINGSVTVRTRFPSDEIRLRGRNCTKTLKKLFNELKIPPELREIIPVACDDTGVVWIYGVGVSERVAVDENTVKAIEFVANKINKNPISGDVKYDNQ